MTVGGGLNTGRVLLLLLLLKDGIVAHAITFGFLTVLADGMLLVTLDTTRTWLVYGEVKEG